MTNHTALLPVEQIDREAAADSPHMVGLRAAIRAGKFDDNEVVQSFARHRLAAHRLQAPAEAGDRKTLFPPIDFGDSAALHTERLADTPATTLPDEPGEEVERVARAIYEAEPIPPGMEAVFSYEAQKALNGPEWVVYAKARAAITALRANAPEAGEVERLRKALDAAHFYIDASDGELRDLGNTREDALVQARELRAALASGAGDGR